MKKKSIIILLAGITLIAGAGAAIPYFYSSADRLSGQEAAVDFTDETIRYEDIVPDVSEVSEEGETDPDSGEPAGEETTILSESPNLILDEKTWITPEELAVLDTDAALRTAAEKKPEDYSTESLRSMAQKYIDEGITIYDLEYAAFHANCRFCCGDYAFINGFMVQEEDYNEVIACATPEEFSALLDSQYNIGIAFYVTSDSGCMTTYEAKDDYNNYSLTYDENAEVFVYRTDYRVPITGGVG